MTITDYTGLNQESIPKLITIESLLCNSPSILLDTVLQITIPDSNAWASLAQREFNIYIIKL